LGQKIHQKHKPARDSVNYWIFAQFPCDLLVRDGDPIAVEMRVADGNCNVPLTDDSRAHVGEENEYRVDKAHVIIFKVASECKPSEIEENTR